MTILDVDIIMETFARLFREIRVRYLIQAQKDLILTNVIKVVTKQT